MKKNNCLLGWHTFDRNVSVKFHIKLLKLDDVDTHVLIKKLLSLAANPSSQLYAAAESLIKNTALSKMEFVLPFFNLGKSFLKQAEKIKAESLHVFIFFILIQLTRRTEWVCVHKKKVNI